MVTQTLVCRAPEGEYDPFRNLAVEKYLTFRVQEGQCILFLWQNRRTVVIGRNQNAWKECNTAALAADGGHLARRLSGGGAVFHDLGNLNFSFCVRREDYDVDRQLEVIRRALLREGIEACKSGRNDLLAEGRKFSGNAFYKSGDFCCHHGTIMIDVNRELIGKYLNVPERKLLSKGITSVQSRVVNLKELRPDLTIGGLSASLREAFSEVYGCEAREDGLFQAIDGCEAHGRGALSEACEQIRRDEAFFASREWIFGTKVPFSHQLEGDFAWGGAQVLLQVEQGTIAGCRIHSDAMDQDGIQQIAAALEGCLYEKQAVLDRLRTLMAEQTGEERFGMLSDIRNLMEKELN